VRGGGRRHGAKEGREGDGKMGRKGKKEGGTCSIASRGDRRPWAVGRLWGRGGLTLACAGSADNKPLSVTSFTKADRKFAK